MMLDKELIFAEAQGPFNTGTNASTNYLNRGVDSDWGKGEPMWLFVAVTETAVGATSTVNIRLVTDDNSSFSSVRVLWETGVQAVGVYVAGLVYRIRIPSGFEQYTRVEFVVATANQSAGKYSAMLVRDVDDIKIYPRANYPVA